MFSANSGDQPVIETLIRSTRFAGNLPPFAEPQSRRLKPVATLEVGDHMDEDRWERKREQWERRWERRRARFHSPGKHLAAGLILTAIGLIFLLGNMGYLDVRRVFAFWPVILIIFGVVRIVTSRGCRQTAGIFGVVVGLLFLLGSFGIIRLAFRRTVANSSDWSRGVDVMARGARKARTYRLAESRLRRIGRLISRTRRLGRYTCEYTFIEFGSFGNRDSSRCGAQD